jgi:hypothetical protein
MLQVQLYIGSDRVELFGGDTITITDSIRNAKDIAKVFTTFSTQFTVPASKTNNIIFKHYYNYNIDSTYAFDARKKVSARIEIDTLPFKEGRIKLDGVDMRNNAPYAYRITFFGSIVDLKDLLGEDKLPSLTDLDIDKDYSPTAIKNALTATGGAAADGTIVPLITSGQRLYYNSGQNSDQSGNLYYGTANQGVKFDQLKYAIKVGEIIDAIESKYNEITFAASSFFKAVDQYDFNELYMWCHRKKGTQQITSGGEYDYDFTSITGDSEGSLSDGAYVMWGDVDYQIRTIDIITEASAGYEESVYEILLFVNGSIYNRYPNLSGNQSISVELGNTFDPDDVVSIKINTYDETVGLSSDSKVTFVYLYESQGGDLIKTDNALLSTDTFASSYKFNVAENLPDMKIIDFLSSLFKMFNLVAYVDNDNKIQVQTLDEFYSNEERDITTYVDINKSQVDAALPYKEITFGYADTKTLLAQQHYQEIAQIDAATGRGPFEWGAVEYSATDGDLSGGTYNIKPAFHHMKFEKLIDDFNSDDTGVQVGYFVDDNEEEYLGSPLLFYSNLLTPNLSLGFLTRDGRLEIESSTVYCPSNHRDIDDEDSESIHFNPERNEYTNEIGTSTLFSRYYQNYIENLFDVGTRIIKVSAVLPTRILTKLTLADIVVINGEKYRINSYSANINTGRTELELINKYD